MGKVIAGQETMHWKSIQQDRGIGKDFKIIPNTSLNEKFDIIPEEHCGEGIYPMLKYFAIGLGGEPILDNGSKYAYSQHQAINGSLFNPMPFVIKKVENDLTPEEQKNYRFRKYMVVDEVEYFAYYLKVVPEPESRDFFTEIVRNGDKNVLSVFNTNTDKILNPVPIDKNAVQNSTDVKYINKIIKFFFIFTKEEMDELFNVINILKLDATHINEIGICSGVDFETETGLIEAIDTQIAYIAQTDIFLATDMVGDKDPINVWLEIGGSEPLYNV